MKSLVNILSGLMIVLMSNAFAGTPTPEKETVKPVDTHKPSRSNEQTCSDTLYLRDGRVIPIMYMHETPMTIKFKKCDDRLNRTWSKDKAKVYKIVFEDGKEKVYTPEGVYNAQEREEQDRKNNRAAGAAVGAFGVLLIGILVSGLVLVWMILNTF